MNFSTLDLNLLRVFDAMLEERSVTQVGRRLGVTQSAVSHSLARLREVLGDELFVKTADGMVATPRARSIAPRLHAGLMQLQSSLIEDSFDPAASTQLLTLAADPYARAILLPRVIARVRALAPGIELRVKPGFAGLTDALDAGRVDLAIARYRRIPKRFGTQLLLTERLVWAVRANHPAVKGPLTLECLAGLPHLVRVLADEDDASADLPDHGPGLERQAMQDDGGALNRAMAEVGLEHTVSLTIPDSYAALAIVGETDLAALVPARMAATLAERFGLMLFNPPYPSPPIPLTAVWHLGHGGSPACRWLRDLVHAVAREL